MDLFYFPHRVVVNIKTSEYEKYFVCCTMFLLFLLTKITIIIWLFKGVFFFSLWKPGSEMQIKTEVSFTVENNPITGFKANHLQLLKLNILGFSMEEQGPPNSLLVGKWACFFFCFLGFFCCCWWEGICWLQYNSFIFSKNVRLVVVIQHFQESLFPSFMGRQVKISCSKKSSILWPPPFWPQRDKFRS